MRSLRTIIFSLIVLITLVIVVVLFIRKTATPKYSINMSSQTVIKQLVSLNRLETAQYTIEKVIDAGTNGNAFQQVLFGDKLLLIAHGEVIAGFDLSKITKEDISISGTTLNVTLDAPEILVSKLDNDQTRVYDRRQGLLTKGDAALESKARSAAEIAIRTAACQGNILGEASKNARNQLTTLFKSTGFTTVIITIPDGSC